MNRYEWHPDDVIITKADDVPKDHVEFRADDFDESKHPRAPDGRWGEGGGGGGKGHSGGGGGDGGSSGKDGSGKDGPSKTREGSGNHAGKASAERRHLIANSEMDKNETKAGVAFKPEVQKAIREEVVATLAKHGIVPTGSGVSGKGIHSVTIMADSEIPGVGGNMDAKGTMTLSHSSARNVQELSRADPKVIGQRMDLTQKMNVTEANQVVYSGHVITHEQIHACGPQIHYYKSGIGIEEMTTEMSARYVTGQTHGVPSNRLYGGYNKMIFPVVAHIQKLSGVSGPEAFKALEHASLEWKRRPDSDTRPLWQRKPQDAIDAVAKMALEHAGVKDPDKHAQLSERIVDASKVVFGHD